MRRISLISNLIPIITILVLLATGCEQNDVAAVATDKATADKKAVGRWRLVGITSGWTGKTSPPTEKAELVISQQRGGLIYENGKQVLTFEYTLEETTVGVIRYSIIQKTGKSTLFYPPEKGNFRVSSKQLIIGDTGIDGPDYIFERE